MSRRIQALILLIIAGFIAGFWITMYHVATNVDHGDARYKANVHECIQKFSTPDQIQLCVKGFSSS